MPQFRPSVASLMMAAFLCPLFALTELHAQSSPFLAGLEPGRYPVGFSSFWLRDRSRTWKPSVDSKGRTLSADPARPVRINVWYPASAAKGHRMVFGDYLGSARTPGFEKDESRVRTDDLGGQGKGLRGLFNSTRAFESFMQTPTIAMEDAAPARGSFPIVIYSLGQGDYTQENTPLSEYLASRGYVVLSVPGLGTSPRRAVMFIHDGPSYEGQVRDLAFALASVASRFPSADTKRIAAVGHSMGGVYALMLAHRYSAIRTVIGLDPSFVSEQPSFIYKYWATPEMDPSRFHGRLLVIHRGGAPAPMEIVDSLRYADRMVITMDSSVHADFNGYPAYTSHAPPAELDSFALARRTQSTALRTYIGIARYLGCFLDASLIKGRVVVCAQPQTAHAVHLEAAHGADEEQLYDIMESQGVPAARAEVSRILGTNPDRLPLRRATMFRIANELGYAGRPTEAANFAAVTTAVFRDADSYERAGDAYAEIGDAANAIMAYEAAKLADPNRSSVIEKLSKLRNR